MRTINDLFCPECLIAKAKRGPNQRSVNLTTRHLQPIHMDVLRQIRSKLFGGRSFTLGILEDFTSYSNIFIPLIRSQVCNPLREYIERIEHTTGQRLQSVWMDGAVEHKAKIVTVSHSTHKITLDSNYSLAPESNGCAERPMQKMLLLPRVIIFNPGLPE